MKQMRILLGILLFTVFSFSAQGQRRLKNQPRYDRQGIHFGFSIGGNAWDFNVEPIADLAALAGYYSIRSETSPGYNINIIANLRLSDHFDLRLLPGFSSTERTLYFNIDDPFTGRQVEQVRKIQSSFADIPLLLKFKSDRINNYRMYTIGGVKYNYDFASKKDVSDDRFFKINDSDLSYEIGFGLDFYFEFFKMSPEIKASWGFSDILIQDDTFLVEGIQRLESRAIVFSICFE
jgi:hypothetical protein